MDLSSPIRSVVPSSHGDVLAVLARTDRALSGRQVAGLTGGRVSQKGANLALRALASAGLVVVEDHPPAKLYRLNRRHLAADAVQALASLRERLIDGIRFSLGEWAIPAHGAWLFGSAARGDGQVASDIDVLVVRPDAVGDDDDTWLSQVAHLVDDVTAWTGNSCEVVEYSADEFEELMASDEALAEALRRESIALTTHRLPPRAARVRRR